MKATATTVLIDFSNLAWACFYAGKDNGDDSFHQTKRNMELKLSYLEKILRVPMREFVFVLDDRAQHKYDTYPEYKAGRHNPGIDPRPEVAAWLRLIYENRFVRSKGNEADDAIATLATHADGPVIVVSGDHDLWQLLALQHVAVYDSKAKVFVNPERIREKFGVENPQQIAMVKALWGDKSDNLPNLAPRLQKHLLPVIRASDGTWKGFWTTLSNMKIPKKTCDILHRNCRQILRNYYLARLNPTCPLDDQVIFIVQEQETTC